MARKYEKVQAMLPKVQVMPVEGKTQREIAEASGLSSKADIKRLLHR